VGSRRLQDGASNGPRGRTVTHQGHHVDQFQLFYGGYNRRVGGTALVQRLESRLKFVYVPRPMKWQPELVR
jgi:hypothetical protein